jgi:hypothetical protein
MERRRDAWNKTFFDRITQIDIGRTLKAKYDRELEGQPLPERLTALLEKIDQSDRKKDNK